MQKNILFGLRHILNDKEGVTKPVDFALTALRSPFSGDSGPQKDGG